MIFTIFLSKACRRIYILWTWQRNVLIWKNVYVHSWIDCLRLIGNY